MNEEKETEFDHFEEYVIKELKKGMKGDNLGIPFPLKKLSTKLSGFQKSTMTLVGGMGGSGKTAWVDFNILMSYIYIKKHNSIKGNKQLSLKVTYYSMERSVKYKIQKFVCFYCYVKYGLVIDVATINGWSNKKMDITPDIEEKIKSADKFIKGLLECVTILDGSIHPTGIVSQITAFQEKNGTTVYDEVESGGKMIKINPRYTPNDPELYHIIVLDHMKKLKREKGNSEKDNIDLASGYLGGLRDRYGCIPIMISQFNRSLSDTTRLKSQMSIPISSDFSGTSSMFDDCDICYAIHSPARLHVTQDLGYEVDKFKRAGGGNAYRAVYCLKNTFGSDQIASGLLFTGEVGFFRELPKPEDKADLEKIYEKLKRE